MYRVLLFTRCMSDGGTEKVIIQLCRILKMNGNEPIVCAAKGRSVEILTNEKIKFYEIPDMQSKSPFIIFAILSKLIKIIKEEKIDIIHTHHRMAAFYTRLILPFVDAKFINNIHNTFCDKKFLTKFAYEKALNIAVGEAVKINMVEDYKIPEKQIKVIYNAVNNNDVIYSKDALITSFHENNFFVVGNIGRINTQKGFEYYIRAASVFKEKKLKIKLIIIGDGVLKGEMEKLVKSLGLEKIVYFYGFSDNVLNIISQLDLVVLSSLWEGFPLIPIETFAMGKTIIATDVPGTMEIVQNGINGIVVSKKDPNAIANAIIDLYQNKEKKNKLEKCALETYRKKFSYNSFCDNYMKIYKLQK